PGSNDHAVRLAHQVARSHVEQAVTSRVVRDRVCSEGILILVQRTAHAITASLSSLSLPSTVVATNHPGWAGTMVTGLVSLIFMATPSVAQRSTARRPRGTLPSTATR